MFLKVCSRYYYRSPTQIALHGGSVGKHTGAMTRHMVPHTPQCTQLCQHPRSVLVELTFFTHFSHRATFHLGKPLLPSSREPRCMRKTISQGPAVSLPPLSCPPLPLRAQEGLCEIGREGSWNTVTLSSYFPHQEACRLWDQ